MKLVVQLKDIVINILFVMLLFIICLANIGATSSVRFFLKHFDEIIVIIFIGYMVLNLRTLLDEKKKLLIIWICFLSIGGISSIKNHYQSFWISVADMVTIISKFASAYFATYVFCTKSKKKLSDCVYRISKVISIVLFVLVIHDIVYEPFFIKADYRYFMESLRLMFPHPTYLAACSATLFIYFGYRGIEKNVLYMILNAIVICSTLRSKTLGFLALYIVFYILLKEKYGKKHPIQMVGLGAVAALIVGWGSVTEYYFTTRYSPRLLLLKDSLVVAKKFFPFGAGYATFGSSLAADYYSPLYIQLGYNNYWGMSSDMTSFLCDSFWPIILGELGFFGVLFFLFICAQLAKYALEVYKLKKSAGFSMLAIIGYMLVMSMAETSFFNPTSMLMFMMFAVFEAETRREHCES